jgi:hypothetical protein
VKVLLDLNVLLDVVQHRVPHYEASAQVLSCARRGEITATPLLRMKLPVVVLCLFATRSAFSFAWAAEPKRNRQ